MEYEGRMTTTELLEELEKWSETYEFNFQFWGRGKNHFFVSKGGTDLHSEGDFFVPEDAIRSALGYIYRINRNVNETKD